jgi:hypothetical protein
MTMKTITQDGITYRYCYVKGRGTSWTYGYYPEKQMIEAKEKNRKKTPRQKLEDTCLEMWSDIIHKKFNHTCQMCGKKDGVMNAHHILLKKTYKSYKYDIDNGILLCYHCHHYADNAPHESPDNFKNWFAKKYPEWDKEIEIKRASKTRKLDMKAVYQELKNWKAK